MTPFGVSANALALENYTVSQKSPTFTSCYNFYIHSSIATIFGTNVAEKAGNQKCTLFSYLT